MISYVLGFAFDISRKNVLLIEKQRPDWQKGRLNGLGGKIENNDDVAVNAMIREFKEECGLVTSAKDWEYVGRLYGREINTKWEIHIFKSFFEREIFNQATTVTDEKICPTPVAIIHNSAWIIPNLKWIIPLCLSNEIEPFEIGEKKNGQLK